MIFWLSVFAALSAALGAWAYCHRPGWLSVAVFPLLCAGIYIAGAEAMGQPKPLWMEWRDLSDAKVLAYELEEGAAIHLWLHVDGTPRNYTMSWSRKNALSLRAAMAQGKERGTVIMMRKGDRSLEDREPLFYAAPQPAYPAKQ